MSINVYILVLKVFGYIHLNSLPVCPSGHNPIIMLMIISRNNNFDVLCADILIYTRWKVENQYVTFEFVSFFQYLFKLVFTTPIQIVS